MISAAALGGVGGIASAVDVHPIQRAPRFRIEVLFGGMPMPPALAASAMKEASLIWAPYGVDVFLPGAYCTADAIQLDVTLVDHDVTRLGSKTLGSIQFDGGVPEPAIAMYPNAIAALASESDLFGRRETAWPIAIHEAAVGRALGRALAHEIGHFLLRTRQHSPTGLMQAMQSISALIATDRRPFVLSADEVTRLGSN